MATSRTPKQASLSLSQRRHLLPTDCPAQSLTLILCRQRQSAAFPLLPVARRLSGSLRCCSSAGRLAGRGRPATVLRWPGWWPASRQTDRRTDGQKGGRRAHLVAGGFSLMSEGEDENGERWGLKESPVARESRRGPSVSLTVSVRQSVGKSVSESGSALPNGKRRPVSCVRECVASFRRAQNSPPTVCVAVRCLPLCLLLSAHSVQCAVCRTTQWLPHTVCSTHYRLSAAHCYTQPVCRAPPSAFCSLLAAGPPPQRLHSRASHRRATSAQPIGRSASQTSTATPPLPLPHQVSGTLPHCLFATL